MYSIFISQLSADVLSQLRGSLLQIWVAEESRIMIKRLNHLLAQITKTSQWIDLIPQVLSNTNEADENKVEGSLNLIEIVSDYSEEYVGNYMQPVLAFIAKYLSSSSEIVQKAAARSICGCIVNCEDPSTQDSFKPALPLILQVRI